MRLVAYRALLYAQCVSAICLALIIVASPAVKDVTVRLLMLAALLGAFNTAGLLLLYRALAIGQIAILAPVNSSFAVVTLTLSLLMGNPTAPAKMAGLLLMVVGVLLAASPYAESNESGAWFIV